MEKLKKAYYLLFYKLSCFFKEISNDNWEKPKALIVINALCVLLLAEIIVWWAVIFKTLFNFSKYWFVIPVVVIVALNYSFFMQKHNWDKYEEEFKHNSKRKSIMAGWIVFLFLLTVLGSLIFAFYQMSLIDWSQYR